MHNMSLTETAPFTMRIVCLQTGGAAPLQPPACASLLDSIIVFANGGGGAAPPPTPRCFEPCASLHNSTLERKKAQN